MRYISGTAISVGLLSHVLKINDGLIGAMACLGKIVAGLFYTFATTEWMYYIGMLTVYFTSKNMNITTILFFVICYIVGIDLKLYSLLAVKYTLRIKATLLK